MYQIISENPARNVTRYEVKVSNRSLNFGEALEGWRNSAEFRSFFTEVLSRAPYDAFRWETPMLTKALAERAFEFVLLDASGFTTRPTDTEAFRSYFTKDDHDAGVVSFPNLGGDAHLIVPSPRSERDAYGHLADFIRHGPAVQIDALWRVVARTAQEHLSDVPLWLSTAGGGVAWLHVRLDSRPKYYGYAPYTKNPV